MSFRSLLTRLLFSMAALAVLTLALGAGGSQFPDDHPLHFAGLVNDYGPSTISGGPYEMRGTWTLDVHHDYADFSVILNMETSDYGVTTGVVTPSLPATRGAHTHLISLTHASLSDDTSHCPVYNPAPTTGPVIVVTGQPQIITGNGGPAPFQLKGPSTLWICLAGGTTLPFSNLAFTFTDGPATSHFGTYPIHGVVIPAQGHDHDH